MFEGKIDVEDSAWQLHLAVGEMINQAIFYGVVRPTQNVSLNTNEGYVKKILGDDLWQFLEEMWRDLWPVPFPISEQEIGQSVYIEGLKDHFVSQFQEKADWTLVLEPHYRTCMSLGAILVTMAVWIKEKAKFQGLIKVILRDDGYCLVRQQVPVSFAAAK